MLLVLVAAAPAGCAAYQPPSIRLADVRLAERSDEAASFSFELVVENPNEVPIELREIRYTLALDGTTIYHGRRAALTTLHAGTSSVIVLPAVVRYDRAGWTADALPPQAEYELAGGMVYVTPGALAEMLLDTGVRTPTASFRQAGSLSFAGGP